MTTITDMRTTNGEALRRPLGTAVRRPAAPGAAPPARRDWIIVGIAAVGLVVEAALRQDLAWPVASALATLAALVALPWRRVRPFAVVAWTFGIGAAHDLADILAGHGSTAMYSAVLIVLAPYALFRWGSGRAILAGTPLIAGGLALSVIAGVGGLDDAIGGVTVLVLVALVGEVVRQRSMARARELDRVRAREREAVARDLHDTVAHHLSAVAVRAQAGQVSATAAAGDPAAAVEALRLVEAEARRALAEMRSLVGVLRSETPRELTRGLDRLQDLADPGPPPVRLHVADGVEPLPAATSTAVVRIAQEAVANARRHARGATGITVTLERHDGVLDLIVHDDGAAVPHTRHGTGHEPPSDTGFGLTGMNERARALGGTLVAGPDEERGWTVHAVLPVPAERPGHAAEGGR
ncbi:sensor histidine kinase [Myceligenerans pegani]|uniref:histidine kinase n=1 Tax=Myceligenerans pegani TaxID=2776917 RepID=A0ABR9MYP7_9MICO|nr:histidine kinase [Myceligenerans sp. TRM 65318]MBE1876499.1 sensor histidine kinase [Myceligenerans sp. TRM 65318]MBE3018770.1 sensor histidine kinase [Myceligenerans sp. TRM 65318]